ncbi:hypothetical protein M0657_007879 [Pyricularia oryzae]|uniref:Uncharacterized protein n=1 Tax=Pyricularia oryzae TaxID=318829 RepID=A0A4P7N7L3_PYROR|nr:hypothetical protein M0657_007879 [Pyricularia oryzae]KAI7924886.1 hypothetical protein M9X92_003598 [Pyricularia oryzae]QBZ57211.1 hypothetical protein PoMZ_02135 [Pyricularia oryzae]
MSNGSGRIIDIGPPGCFLYLAQGLHLISQVACLGSNRHMHGWLAPASCLPITPLLPTTSAPLA